MLPPGPLFEVFCRLCYNNAIMETIQRRTTRLSIIDSNHFGFMAYEPKVNNGGDFVRN